MNNSFVELNARQRAFSIINNGSGRELINPEFNTISPHLEPQGIVPESDDGVVLVRGEIANFQVLIISIEGLFQGGGIGEVSGAKIVSSLEKALHVNKTKKKKIYPIFILDTGGVRLQEANYGLLSISELQNMIVALKKYVPVIGIVPGRVGSFGGMSITAAMMSYLISTKKARIALNGPEVIEQEAGVREFDASDKNLVWNTLGARERAKTGLIDELVEDQVTEIIAAIKNAIEQKKDVKRTDREDFYLSLLENIEFKKSLSVAEYEKIYNANKVVEHIFPEAITGNEIVKNSRGRIWFEKLTGIKNAQSNVRTVLHAYKNQKEFIAIVPNENNTFCRVQNGEVGLQEGFTIAKIVKKIITDDKDQVSKRPIILIVDVPSQAYGYKEELIGIHLSLAASAEAYAKARQVGHPVIALIVGDAVSGGFLAHGLQANRIIALADKSITIQAMSKASAARITKRTVAQLEEATRHVPAMAYDIFNYKKLGALYSFVENVSSWNPTREGIDKVSKKIDAAIMSVLDNGRGMHFRYENSIAKSEGRQATINIRKLMEQEW
ncbi:biotin-independent malonate decarboxylase subunit beta [Liquorilactobacillus hordei]|uniref:Biotin-independent malonate decarboxylase subunit beta n=1 Tax=Liquorilactobacillus hordei TaxID=468911 RepID=A0A3Q8C949_9LACO|nr:biotin-independent malonate decarboxylase subunit beta [Liquorilactobacillus hordei]AUJ29458.1 biotin-independent malonate decarboxylase subunit beta [Liquorilactobacillus hordei]